MTVEDRKINYSSISSVFSTTSTVGSSTVSAASTTDAATASPAGIYTYAFLNLLLLRIQRTKEAANTAHNTTAIVVVSGVIPGYILSNH